MKSLKDTAKAKISQERQTMTSMDKKVRPHFSIGQITRLLDGSVILLGGMRAETARCRSVWITLYVDQQSDY
jgi:hypothetical protein